MCLLNLSLSRDNLGSPYVVSEPDSQTKGMGVWYRDYPLCPLCCTILPQYCHDLHMVHTNTIHTGACLSTTNSMAARMGEPLVCLLLRILIFLLPGVGIGPQGAGSTMGGTPHCTVGVPYALPTLYGSPQVHGKHSKLFFWGGGGAELVAPYLSAF